MFEQLDFVYLPSRDVAAELTYFTDGLGATLVFAIEAFETRVAMVRLAPDPPACYSPDISMETVPCSSIACETSTRR